MNGTPSGEAPRFAFGCIAMVILGIMVAAGLAVVFLWDVNAL